jgi:hypothetical protein
LTSLAQSQTGIQAVGRWKEEAVNDQGKKKKRGEDSEEQMTQEAFHSTLCIQSEIYKLLEIY